MNISFCFRKDKQFTGDVKCYFLEVYQPLVIMKKSYYGELNRLTEVQKKHLTRDKVLPFGPQGTSQVIVRNEGCTSRRPERFASTRFHNCVPTQVQLQANKVFLMSCLIKNNLAGLREFCQPERTRLKETASSQFIK